MKSILKKLIVLGFVATMTACGGGVGDAANSGAASVANGATGGDAVTLADPKAIGESCSADCGAGGEIGILCAVGETPVCDCNAAPRTLCNGS